MAKKYNYTAKRQAVWTHNSFFGHARMMRANAASIIRSSTASDKAKMTASEIYSLALRLLIELRERVDAPHSS